MCEGYSSTPIELATKVKDLGDLLNILEEFIEIPVSAKLDKLSVMMEINNEEDTKEAFQKSLSSLPRDLVRAKQCFSKFELISGEHEHCAWIRNSSAKGS